MNKYSKLNKTDRKIICSILGMVPNDENIFVTDTKAFNDRMNTLSSIAPMNVNKLIDALLMDKESAKNMGINLESFLMMNADILCDALDNHSENAFRLMCEYCDEAGAINEQLVKSNVPIDETQHLVLRIYVDNPIYEYYKLLTYFDSSIVSISEEDFIRTNTTSELFKVAGIDKLVKSIVRYKHSECAYMSLSNIIFSNVCPKYINSNSLINVDKTDGSLMFTYPKNYDVHNIDDIINYINNINVLLYNSINIELYELEPIILNDSVIFKKNQIIGNDNIFNYLTVQYNDSYYDNEDNLHSIKSIYIKNKTGQDMCDWDYSFVSTDGLRYFSNDKYNNI